MILYFKCQTLPKYHATSFATRFVMTYTNDLSIFIFHTTQTRYIRENGGLANMF